MAVHLGGHRVPPEVLEKPALHLQETPSPALTAWKNKAEAAHVMLILSRASLSTSSRLTWYSCTKAAPASTSVRTCVPYLSTSISARYLASRVWLFSRWSLRVSRCRRKSGWKLGFSGTFTE